MSEITLYYSFSGKCRKHALKSDNNAVEITTDYVFSNNKLIKFWQVNKLAKGKINFEIILDKDFTLDDYDTINIISPVWNEKLCLPVFKYIIDNKDELNSKTVNITAVMRGNRNFVEKQISPILTHYNLNSISSLKIK